MNIRTYLEKQPLLFDGAMGTYYAACNHPGAGSCEQANLLEPDTIKKIHREYLSAGCGAIKTNTFGINRPAFGDSWEALLDAGYQLAVEAAGDRAFVFADIGPIDSSTPQKLYTEYQLVADRFLSLGAEYFLFETHSSDACLHEIAAYIKGKNPNAFVLTSFAAQPDGFTRAGIAAKELISRAEADENIDAVGLNCVSGAKHMAELVDTLGPVQKPLSVMPNAGYPTVLGSRTFYNGDPAYFALQLSELEARGAKILGGCCGTTPEHIAAAAVAVIASDI